MENYLVDEDFLKELFSSRHRETYAKITSLTLDEKPQQSLEGRITSGSVRMDANSSVRRSCSLSFATSIDTAYNDYYWALTTKFKLEIGLKNNISKKYSDVIYFPLGTYVITNFSMSLSPNSFNINIEGKDKMCLVNGEIGGELFAAHDFGTEDLVTENGTERKLIEYEQIIRNIMVNYAYELPENVIVRDVPKFGLFLMESQISSPIYLLVTKDYIEGYISGLMNQVTPCFDKDKIVYLKSNGKAVKISDSNNINYYSTNELIGENIETKTSVTLETDGGTEYYILKIEPNQIAGFTLTDLTPTKENGKEGNSTLTVGVGGNLTQALDKIVKDLGDFEYFYDEYGRFIFQMKNRFVDRTWYGNDFSSAGFGNEYEMNATNKIVWSFDRGQLITSYSNSPNLSNIKNDFSIWGERNNEGSTQTTYVHLRYAIDEKPKLYTTVAISLEEAEGYVEVYKDIVTKINPQANITYCSLEYKKENPELAKNYIAVDWRHLIYLMAKDNLNYGYWDTFKLKIVEANGDLYPKGITKYEQYYTDILEIWPQLYDTINFKFTENIQSPEKLNLWFDFMDINGSDLGKYSAHAIMPRIKSVSDSETKNLYYRKSLSVIFMKDKLTEKEEAFYNRLLPFVTENYQVCKITEQEMSNFTISKKKKSCKDVLDTLIYQNAHINESVNISAIPVYHLHPNDRITLANTDTLIGGQYDINSITLPLNYNGTMSISAIKAVNSLY